MKNIKKSRSNKKGFTLIEMMVVIGIIVVITAVAVPMLIQYYKTSQMIKYNDYAKTIFLSTQSYLSDKKSAGKLKEVENLTANKVTADMVDTAYFGGDNLSYMMLSKDGNGSDANLTKMLENYIGDPSMLKESICVEYNAKQGVVYSVSYSESAKGFCYDTANAEKDGKTSISNRDSKEREKRRFGYYSAKGSDLEARGELEPSSINLYNENKLYAEWTDAQPKGSSVVTDIDYTVKIYNEAGMKPIMSFVVSSGAITAENQNDLLVQSHLIECPTTYYNENGTKKPTVNEKHWVYSKSDNTSGVTNIKYGFVLDSVDTSINVAELNQFSILTKYAAIGERNIRASIKASVSDHSLTATSVAYSNGENTLFASEATDLTPAVTGAGQKIELANARHLYNTRYKESSKNEFIQTEDISWEKALEDRAIICGGKILNETQVFETNGKLKQEWDIKGYAFASLLYKDPVSGSEISFQGTYDGKGKKIEGLYITGQYEYGLMTKGQVGLFAQNEGIIQNVNMSKLTVRNSQTAEDSEDNRETGTVAAVNKAGGKIKNVTVEAEEITGRNQTGGIVGMNAGSVADSNTNCQVSGMSEVGGIIGANTGEGVVLKCNTTGGKIVGTGADVGGIIGSNSSNKLEIVKFENVAEVQGKQYAGGIIGNNENGLIKECVNKGLVWATEAYGGGITGANGKIEVQTQAKIQQCKSEVTTELTEAELLERATGDYIGGITGYNNGTITAEVNKKIDITSVVMGKNFVGGVAGHNDSKGYVANYQLMKGTVIATEDFAGGFFGLNTSRNTENSSDGGSLEMSFYSKPDRIMGRNYVGGVIGANLVTVSKGEDRTLKFSSTGPGGKDTGSLEANAYAGGVIGYNGVISLKTGATAEEQLQETLEQLKERNPFEDGVLLEPESGITTLIDQSNNHLSITAKRYVGGIIGENSNSSVLKITKCINYGKLSVGTQDTNPYKGDNYYIGGITGRNSKSGVIVNSENAGEVVSLSKYTGGITEINEGLIEKCRNSGKVTSAKGYVGGITGLNGDTNVKALMTGCTSTVDSQVKGSSYLGGFAGENRAQIIDCKSPVGTIGEDKTEADYVGGIVGNNKATGLLENVEAVSGTVTGKNYVGGIAGASENSIKSITNGAIVTGVDHVGGILGGFDKTAAPLAVYEIIDCTNTGTISAGSTASKDTEIKAGGITGENAEGDKISNCNNKGNVSVSGLYAGGIVSYNNGTLEDCIVTGGTITGSNSAGGLLGLNRGNGVITGNQTDLVSNASIISNSEGTGKYYIGGLMAENNSAGQITLKDIQIQGVTISYKTPGEYSNNGKQQYAGGIIGFNKSDNIIDNCSFVGTLNGGGNGTGGIAGENQGTIRNILLGEEKVSVASNGVSGGLAGVSAVNSVETNVENKANLTVKGKKWVGGFYGRYEKSDLTKLTNNAIVEGDSAVGGIAGEIFGENIQVTKCINQGTVKGSSSNGTVSENRGNMDLGGILGVINNRAAVITECQNIGIVDGLKTQNVGGIIGRSIGTGNNGKKVMITDCKNGTESLPGSVNSETLATGGIIGRASSFMQMSDCENNGLVKAKGAYAGGIVGKAIGETNGNGTITILKCSNNGRIENSGSWYTGGISGYTGSANGNETKNTILLQECFNEGPVKAAGGKEIGGITGELKGKNNKVISCENRNEVSATGDLVGGIVGQLRDGGMIQSCINAERAIVSNTAGYTGGILGEGISGEGTISDCLNEGTVKGSGGSSYLGGIAGSLKGSNVVINCQNTSTSKFVAGNQNIGGIVGFLGEENRIEKPAQCKVITSTNAGVILTQYGFKNNVGGIVGNMTEGTVRDCENKAEAFQTGAKNVGGIIGNINAKTTPTIINNVNYTAIQGAAPVGGIIGQGIGNAQPVKVEQCRNEGVITNAVNSSEGMGGIIGSFSRVSGTIENCINYAEVKKTAAVANVGGIIGNAQGVKEGTTLEILKSANYGPITQTKSLLPGERFGGIAGIMSDYSNATNCYNFGEMTLDNSSQVGGIAGQTGSKTIIYKSVNSANISALQSDVLGGVVGSLGGQVISCQNRILDMNHQNTFTTEMQEVFQYANDNKPDKFVFPEAEDSGLIQVAVKEGGGNNLGGIVGRTMPGTSSVESIGSVMSDPNSVNYKPEYDYTKNMMTIQLNGGTAAIGGIVGHLWGGSTVKAYNLGKIIVPKGATNTGGIAGRITKTGTNSAVLAGTFHIGTIFESSNYNKGGIAGNRDIASGASMAVKPSVKDSYFMENAVPETNVKDGITGEWMQGKWRIGTEPYKSVAEMVKPDTENDEPKIGEKPNQEIFSLFNKDEFGSMLPEGIDGNIDYNDPAAAERLIQQYLKDYMYKLDMPEIISVDINPLISNAYSVQWTGGQGSLRGYKLYYELYEPDGKTKTGEIIESGEIPFTQDRIAGQAFAKEKIGQFFKVGVQALGKDGETIDSDVNYKDDIYMILPQMLKPEISYENTGERTYRFTLTNLEAYGIEGKPSADLGEIGERLKNIGSDVPDYEKYLEAYKKYINRLDYINMYITETKENIKFVKQADGSYIADHTFELGNGVVKKDFNLQFKAMPSVDKPYTYYVSDPNNIKLTVEKTYKLDTPPIIEMTYTGDLNEANYAVVFDSVTNGKDYKITVYCEGESEPVMSKTVSGTGKQTAEIGKEYFTEERLGKKFTVKVQAMGHDSVYLDSDENSTEFTCVSRLSPPEITAQRIPDTDQYEINWTGDGDKFAVEVNQKEWVTGIEKSLYSAPDNMPATGKQYIADYTEKLGNGDTDIVNGFDLSGKIHQVGVLGQSLNSVNAEGELCKVYPRLPVVAAPNLSIDPNQALTYTFDWSTYLDNGTVNGNICKGYLIYAVNTDSGKVEQIGRTDSFDSTDLSYTFDPDTAGGKRDIYVVALGVDGQKSNSKKGNTVVVQFPDRPTPPKDVVVTPNTPALSPVSESIFESTDYRLSWNKPDDSGTIITSYNWKITVMKNGVEEIVKGPNGDALQGNILAANLSSFEQPFKLSADYAGLPLTAKVQSCPDGSLNSLWTDGLALLPTIQAESVKDISFSKTIIPDPAVPSDPAKNTFTYTISFDGVKRAKSYHIKVQAAEALDTAPALYEAAILEQGFGAKQHIIAESDAKALANALSGKDWKIIVTSMGDPTGTEPKQFVDAKPTSKTVKAEADAPKLTADETVPGSVKFTWEKNPNMDVTKYRLRLMQYDNGSTGAGKELYRSEVTADPVTGIMPALEYTLSYAGITAPEGCRLVFIAEQIDVQPHSETDPARQTEITSMAAVWEKLIPKK